MLGSYWQDLPVGKEHIELIDMKQLIWFTAVLIIYVREGSWRLIEMKYLLDTQLIIFS